MDPSATVANELGGAMFPSAAQRSVKGARLVAFLAPTIIVLQPLFGWGLDSMILFARTIALPLALVAFVRRSVHWPTMLLMLALVVATSYGGIAYRWKDFSLVFLAVFGSIVLYRTGVRVAQEPSSEEFWAALVYGITLLNTIVLVVLAALTLGVLDPATLFERLQRDLDFGFARFSLGNPIEVPFFCCAVLYAAIRHAPSGHTYLGAALINATTAIISQSRIIVLIGILILVGEWLKSKPHAKTVSAGVLIALIFWNWELIDPVVTSVLDRFGGRDFGSGDDRAFLYSTVLQRLKPWVLLVGGGLTSGADLINQVTGTYRTLESTLLQFTYEIGIIGLAAVWASSHFGLPVGRRASVLANPVTLLLWVQILLYLPVTNMMPMSAFALGALAVAHDKRCR